MQGYVTKEHAIFAINIVVNMELILYFIYIYGFREACVYEMSRCVVPMYKCVFNELQSVLSRWLVITRGEKN